MNNAVPELADNTQAYRIEKSKAEEFKTEGLQNEAMILSKLITKEEENSSIKLMNDLEKVKIECCHCFLILLPLNYCNSYTVGLKLISFFQHQIRLNCRTSGGAINIHEFRKVVVAFVRGSFRNL